MISNDKFLLEQAYNKVVSESNLFPYEKDPNDARVTLSKKIYNIDGTQCVLKVEEDRDEDDEWNHFSFVDTETKQHVANMNWGRGFPSEDDVANYINLGLPSGVNRRSSNPNNPSTRINMDSNTLNKFINGTAEGEGLELIPRETNQTNTVGESLDTLLEAKKKKSKKKTKKNKKSKSYNTGIRWGVGTYFTGGGYNFDDTSGDSSGDGA